MSGMTRIALTAALVAVAIGSVEGSSYTITDLGTLPGTNQGVATGINAQGQVVGYANNENASSIYIPGRSAIGAEVGSESFLYSNGQMTEINNLGANGSAGEINSSGQVVGLGQSINDSGQVVSASQTFQVPVTSTVNGVTTTTQTTFTPFAINNSGQILGTIQDHAATGSTQDVGIYQNGKFTDLNKVLGFGRDPLFPLALNNAGSVLLNDLHSSPESVQTVLYNANGTSKT